ncbi:MAG: alcohol dehydrogenase catalytic domain-containing protein, partial [Candidatus Rokubacteria bacterium]|nr:alcohol dehydrogenase catalytic domain-containing protein [Candidatus Rokubacteria bacterium]
MKAVRIHTQGGPEVMRLEDVPEPQPKAGEVVVKLDAAGINFMDVYQRSGLYKLTLPLTLGVEGGGTVSAVGSGVTDVKAGD